MISIAPTDQAQQIAELEQLLTQKDQQINQLRAFRNMTHTIISNKNMSYSDRVFWVIMLENHTEEMINLKPFQPNISRLRQESGLSPDSATKCLASMDEARGIKYSNKAERGENSWQSVSTIVPLAGHASANTKAATQRIKQRDEVKRRRIARKLIIQPCESCGSDDLEQAYSAIIPMCKACNHVSMNQQETVLAKNIRIIEEELIAPTNSSSHEFSEVIDNEWVEDDLDNQVEANSSSHEFSEVTPQTTTEDATPSHEFSAPATEIQPENSPSPKFSATSSEEQTSIIKPSPEFSEGQRVQTPNGIGVISLISLVNNRMRCNIRFPIAQTNGTYYAGFTLDEIQSVSQASLMEETC